MIHSRAVSESEPHAQETTECVSSLTNARALARALTPASQQPVLAPVLTTPFSQDEILSTDLTFSQSSIGNDSYQQENAPSSDFVERVTGTTVGHTGSLFDDTDDISMAENNYTGQSDSLQQSEDGEWDEDQNADEEDMYQQPDEIPPLYPIVYDRLGFPVVDRPLEYRLRLSGDRSGVGWPLNRWRGDRTDLLADDTIDVGVALELDGLSSPTLWKEETTESRGSYSPTTDHSTSSYGFNGPREPVTTLFAAAAMVGSPDMVLEDECIEDEDVEPFAYELDEAILCGNAREDDVEGFSCLPQGESVAHSHQEQGQITEAYPVQRSEPAFDCSQEPTEAVVFADVEMEEAMKIEQMNHEGENSSGAQLQVGSAQEPVGGFVLAPDLFGD